MPGAMVLDAGGNLTLNAGNDVHLIGTQAHAGNELTITAGHDVIIESAQSYSSSGTKNESWNAGIGVGASAGLGGASFGLQIEGGYAHSDRESHGTQQNNAHLTADGSVTIKSGNDTTLAGAVVYAPEVSLDVGNNLTISSRQDTAHSDGSSISGGGSMTIGYGVAVSAYGGFGTSESDVAWVTEQSGIFADGKLDIRVENHTQLNGGVINSMNGDLTLDTGTLGFTNIEDHDKGSAFDMTVGTSFGTLKETPWPWLTAQNSSSGGSSVGHEASHSAGDTVNQTNTTDPRTGLPTGPWAGGSIEEHDREQTTNATIGTGTIIIRNQEAQQQDVATINRDITQAQVITRDESSGVNFYVSGNGLNTITNPVGYSRQIVDNYARQFDQLAALGNNSAALLREAVRNGTFNEDTVRALQECAASGGGQQQGWNILNLFVTPAHAAGTCLIPIGGKFVPIPAEDAKDCARIALDMLNAQRNNFFNGRVDLTQGPDPEFRYGTRDMANDNFQGQVQIKNQGGLTVQFIDENGVRSNVLVNYQGSAQLIYANPVTGGPELYNPIHPAQTVPAPPGTISPTAVGYEGFYSSRDFVDNITVVSPMIRQMQGHTFGIAVEGGSLLIMGGSILASAAGTTRFVATTEAAFEGRLSGPVTARFGEAWTASVESGATARGGLSQHGGVFVSSENAAGGTVWTSNGAISQNDFASIVNSSLMQGRDVRIITGVHGELNGEVRVDSSLFIADVRAFGNVPGVTIFNFPDMTPTQLNNVLNSPGVTIGGFCNSGNCLSPFR